jgi:anti-sigma B factor antagonist
MNVTFKTVHDVFLIELQGSLDGKTAPEVQKQVIPAAESQNNVILDMTGVQYISSAGLRVLLILYRQLKSKGGRIALVGLTDEIKDVMSNTGLLNFFLVAQSFEAGIAALKKSCSAGANRQGAE